MFCNVEDIVVGTCTDFEPETWHFEDNNLRKTKTKNIEMEFGLVQYDVEAFDYEYSKDCLAKGEGYINARNQVVKDSDIRLHLAQLPKYSNGYNTLDNKNLAL